MRTKEQRRQIIDQNEMTVLSRIVDASNATLIGEITGIKVVYKPIAGERPLWDFPDGNLASREVAAFSVSELLEIHRVPYTTLRDGPFGMGMVQEWIEIDENLDLIEFSQTDEPQLRELALFDAVINNTDRKIGHLLIDQSGFLFGCDHGVTFHEEDKLRTVLWQWRGQPLTERERTTLEGFIRNDLDLHLSQLITESEINALRSRVLNLLESNCFPMPSGDWPAIPWPPV